MTGTAGDDANAGGDLDLNSMHKINIIGAGCNLTFVDGNRLDRVFHILKGKVAMSGVTIRGGKAKYIGGGIWNEGNLVLSHCTISGNTTSDSSPCITEEWGEIGGSSGWGGGIANFGSLILTHCIITNNRIGKGGSGGLRQTGRIAETVPVSSIMKMGI
ncbi:MAG: hypothetical protein MUF15_17315 [Acidobacteria bacterium]|nr:hypothetical protein [Acidobacteriota bacterium]